MTPLLHHSTTPSGGLRMSWEHRLRLLALVASLGVALAAGRGLTQHAAGRLDLGVNAPLNGWLPFPPDNPWNQKIDREPVEPNSGALIASIGAALPLHPDFGTTYQGHPSGIPYVVVPGNTPRVP